MNKILRILTGICAITAIAFMSSCVKEEFDPPADNIPTVDFTSNTSIAQLKAMHPLAGVLDTLSDDIIIQGTVVATDESGNYYKDIVIQDGTGGIEILLDQTDIYTTFRLGQKVFVKCKGMYLGDYGTNVQLGYSYDGDIGRLPAIYIKDHIFADSLPGTVPAPAIVTISGLIPSNLGTLIQLDNVYFPESGFVFATTDESATSRTISDGTNTLTMRTSMYANFAGNLIPSGYGSVRGILSIYNGVYQLTIRDKNDLIGFSTDIETVIFYEPFMVTFGSFAPYSVTGVEAWAVTEYGATMSGYASGYHANEDWLISSSINMDNYSDEVMTFQSTMNYGTAGDGSLKLYYSSDYSSGDPNSASWTEITGFALSPGGWADTQSGNIDLSGISGSNIHIAFKYVSTTSSCATWELVNVLAKGKAN